MTRAWTAEDVERLRAMKAQGLSRNVIAARMDRTPRSIAHALSRYRKPLVSRPSRPDDFAASWRAMSQDELADHYRVSVSLVKRWCRELGLVRGRGKHVAARPKVVSFAIVPIVSRPEPPAPEADACRDLAAAMDALYRRKADRLGCSVEAARLVCLYSPAQLARAA